MLWVLHYLIMSRYIIELIEAAILAALIALPFALYFWRM